MANFFLKIYEILQILVSRLHRMILCSIQIIFMSPSPIMNNIKNLALTFAKSRTSFIPNYLSSYSLTFFIRNKNYFLMSVIILSSENHSSAIFWHFCLCQSLRKSWLDFIDIKYFEPKIFGLSYIWSVSLLFRDTCWRDVPFRENWHLSWYSFD